VSEITGGWRAHCATFRRHCPYKDLPKIVGKRHPRRLLRATKIIN
jgi:hypothetical protein